MRSIKRIFSFLLAMLMIVGLLPSWALAEEPTEENPVFLVQPQSGSHGKGESFQITWQLSVTPDRLELVREEDQPGEDGLPETLLVPERELDPAATSLSLTAPEEETVWRLRAFYGEKELISDAFTVTEEPAEEPADPSIRPEGLAQDDSEEELAGKPEAEPRPEEFTMEPEAAPAAADETEELRKPYTLSGRALTFKANGTPDSSNTGGQIRVASTAGSGESVSAEANSVVTCQTQTANGYRLAAVYFGPSSAPLSYDVTNSKRAIMPSEAAVFTAVFIPEGANMPCSNAGVILSAPPLGGSYSGLVNADVTKYFNKNGAAYSALDAYSVSAVWKEEGGANPTSFQIGKRYYAVITVTFNSGWSLGSGFQAALTMPDGSTCSDFLMERVPGGVSFQSPLYTVPETEGWHNLYADVITYDENGDYDASLTGGTVTLSTGCAQEGATVSCTVTVNSGFRLLCVEMGSPHGEPVCDVTDTLQGTMLNRDTDFRAFFITEGAIKPTGAFSVTVTAPAAGTSNANGIPAEVIKSFDAGWPASYHVENAYWRNSSNNLVTTLMPGWTYYPVFDLVPNEGWCFSESPGVLLQYSDLTYFEPNSYDYTLRADGSIHVFGPPYTLPGSSEYQQVIYTVYTADASGELQIGNSSGGTVTLSTDHARPGDTVTVTATPNPGYRLARVLFGTGDHKFYDVTDTLQGTVEEPSLATPISNFNVTFVPDGVRISTYPAAAVRIGAPGTGGNYPNGVPVNTTKYYVDGGGVRFLPSAFEVENAVWTIKYGGTPTTLLAGHKYLAEFDIVPGDCFFFPTDETPYVILTMPDGTEKNSEDGDFTVTRNADGSLHVASPEVTLPGSSSYHNLMGRALTYDENGIYDESLAGGTVTVSAGSAKAGDAVSCQVTVNPGYRLLMVQFCLDHDEPAADVTDSLQAVMWDRDMEFRATFVKDGGSIGCQALAVQLGNPKASGYRSLPAAPALTPYLSMTSLALYPSAFSVTDASWRNANGECIGWFYDVQDYYALFTLRPNPGWTFADNSLIELTMPDGSILRNTDGDFTATPNADGSITVKSPMLHVPSTVQPTGGAIPVVFKTVVYDADYRLVPDVIGGTASYSPANPHPGDTVTVTASPAPGYQLQYVYYDNGLTMGYDATAEMSFTVPEDYGGMELSVCFTPVGTSLPLPSATQKVELPLAGTQNSGAGQVLNGEHQWYDVESVTWYGGAGSGCQGQEPASFLPGARYYAEVILTPHAHWHWRPDTNLLMLYHDPADPDPGSVNWDLPSGSTCSVDAQGRLHVVGEEIMLPGAVPLRLYQYTEGSDGGLLDVVGGTVKFSVNGGTAQTLPASNELMVLPGDQISLSISPNTGYRLQSANWGIGDEFAGDITETLAFTVPEDCSVCEVIVYFAPADAVIPIDRVFLNLPLPLPASSYSAGATQAENENLDNFDILGTFWYGGTGSGCQNAFPSSFINGASYYARIWLVPKDNWCFAEGTQVWIRLEDGSLVEAKSTSFDAETGQFLIETYEYPIYNKNIDQASLGLQMFEEGGEYPQGCPVVFDLPENAPFTVSDAIWYNYADQESGGIGLPAGFFTADGRYFTVFDLIPNEGYVFTAASQINLTNGSVEIKTLNSDGSIHVVTSWYSLNPEAAAQYRRVFVTNLLLNPDGSVNQGGSGGYVLPNDANPKVGDTVILGVMAKNGYRLQWMTVARYSEGIGDDITNDLSYYVDDQPGDVYICAWFAPSDGPVVCPFVNLNVQLPAPGGSYSGLAPASVTPSEGNASEYSVESARWYEYQGSGVGTPESFVPGQDYILNVIVSPNPGWVFADDPGASVYLSSGRYMSSNGEELTINKLDNGNLTITSVPITLPETAVDSVELSLDLPEQGSSFVFMSQPWATFYTPHVGEMYTIWKNGADQATGEEGSQTASFQPGCVYYATIRLHADQGYYLTEDTRVTLRNGLSFTTQYSTTDRSLWIHTESITIPTESYQLSGTYVTFRLNDVEVTSARPGEYVVARSDITTQPLGMYLADVISDDVELKQITEITWGFTMPEKDVTVTGELLPQETYIFELEDGVHEMNARDASWLFGEQEAGCRLDKDLTGDGNTDIFVDFYDDGTARVVRVGNICGDLKKNTPSGRIGTIIYRFGPERYDVYLGSVQVNAENKDNIPVLGGKASYDPETRTLTLTDYTGSIGVIGHDAISPDLTRLFSITASGDLTIRGSGRLTDDSLRGGINCGGNLTLDGDFEISAWRDGIYAEGDLTVSGNVKVHGTTRVGVDVRGDLSVMQGSLRVTADEGIGVDCRGDVTVSGELYSFAGEAGLQCGGNVTLAGGMIMVSSTNDIGLIGSSDLNIQDGGFNAYGNVQALEVASISFDRSTHFISLPQNGYVSSDDTTIIDPVTSDPALNATITDKTPTTTLRVKDLDGNEGVGGYVSFGSGDYFVETSNTVPYGTWLDISASAAPGYLFDHWEDEYGARPNDESDRAETSVGVFVDNVLYAVFEELLPIESPYFTDPNFRAYISENIDLDHDGYLSRAERSLVTSIDVSNKSIGNLVGLKYFPELTQLYCYGNPELREVDVRQNKKILYVQCYSCSKLERLYITGCSELRDLRCYSCNLTGINFTGCTNLIMLQCYGNKLSYLYLGDCHKLGRVDCQNNPNLSELNINSEDLYILFCYSTKLDTLDVSSCPKLYDTYRQGTFSQTTSYDRYSWMNGSTIKGEIRCNKNAEFESNLGIPVNQPNFPDPIFREFISNSVDLNRNGWLSPLEIELCTGIGPEEMDFRNVKGIEFLTEMESLLIDGAPNLKSIDLRANTKLEVIDICDNGLEEIKLDGLTNLYALYVEGNALTEFDISALTLEVFYCYNNPLTSLELGEQPELKTLYAHKTELESLDLSGCPILVDAYLNGTRTEYDGYVKYSGGPLGGTLYIDQDQAVVTAQRVPGDINGDGAVSTADVVLLARYIKAEGEGVDIVPGSADINGDGTVSTADLVLLARYVKADGQGIVIY